MNQDMILLDKLNKTLNKHKTFSKHTQDCKELLDYASQTTTDYFGKKGNFRYISKKLEGLTIQIGREVFPLKTSLLDFDAYVHDNCIFLWLELSKSTELYYFPIRKRHVIINISLLTKSSLKKCADISGYTRAWAYPEDPNHKTIFSNEFKFDTRIKLCKTSSTNGRNNN